MQRYFASLLDAEHIQLTKDDEHHLLHVMRMKKDDEIEAVTNDKLYLCKIKSVNPLDIYIVHELKSDVELPVDITLLFALTKGDKIDLVVQKATELGVKNIALIQSERTVVKYDNKDIDKKIQRFQKIMKEANNLKQLPKEAFSDLNYIAYEKEAGDTKEAFADVTKNKSISILVGPEGGFSEEEVNNLVKQGFIRTSLGKRILRAETAAIYALSVLGYLLEK